MTKALITPFQGSEYVGGVEAFNLYLKKVFPDLMIIDYSKSKNDSLLSKISNISILGLSEQRMAFICGKYFMKLWKKMDFDVVFSNGMFGWYLTLKEIDIPTINIFHGNSAGWADYCIKKRNLNYYITKYQNGMFERISGWNKKIISVSKSVKEQIKKYYGLSSTVIHNGVDLEIFKPIPKEYTREILNLPKEAIIGIFVGRPEYAKGFDIILKLSELNRQIDFLCITDREIEIRNKNIIIRSKIPNKELYKYYSASDFLIFPSRFEGCSYVPLEAMSCNLPVIVSKTGIFYEINPPEVGAVVPTWRVADYSNAIKKILNNRDEFNPRKIVRRDFSFKRFAKDYKNFVSSIVE
jgi:glycosyltransferase involved in cell wall biosynthesis